MKRLYTMLLIISVSAIYAVEKTPLESLAQALELLGHEKTSTPAKTLKDLTDDLIPHKFVTHFLLIISAPDLDKTMRMHLRAALDSGIPFLVTEQLMRAYRGKSNLPDTHRYFKCPLEKDYRIKFILCMPRNALSRSKSSTKDSDREPTWLERELGIYVEHFTEIARDTKLTEASILAKYEADSEAVLRDLFTKLFVPTAFYKDKLYAHKQPRWAIFFSGHGSQYTPWPDNSVLKKSSFIKSDGSIAGLDTKTFSEIISDLSQNIDIKLLYIGTCYGGGINMGNLLRDEALGIIPPYPYVIITSTLTGDTETSIKDDFSFKNFLDVLGTIKVKDIDTLFQSKDFSALTSKDAMWVAYQDAYRELYETLPKAIREMKITKDYIPAMKPIAANYFIPIEGEEFVIIDKDSIRKHATEELIVPQIPTDKQLKILLLATDFPGTIRINNPKNITLQSGIPGSTYHFIETIKGNYNLPFSLLTKTLFTETDNVIKLFHIGRLHDTTNDKSYAVRIVKKAIDWEMLISTLDEHEEKDFKMYKPMKTVQFSEEEAKKWIADFDEKITFLQRLANLQAPYRFLKNAQITTLPL